MIRCLILLSLMLMSVADARTLRVMVIDTGIDLENPAITKYTPKQFLTSAVQDTNGHGTQVTSIIVPRACPGVEIIPCKYYNHDTHELANEIACIEEAIKEKVDIINLSGGGDDPSSAELTDITLFLSNKKHIFVAAAGNNSRNLEVQPYFPACYKFPNMVAVGSLNYSGECYNPKAEKSPSSNYAPFVKWEPGNCVHSITLDNHQAFFTGTSAATAVYTSKLVKKWCEGK